jgi:hypothetical protein
VIDPLPPWDRAAAQSRWDGAADSDEKAESAKEAASDSK